MAAAALPAGDQLVARPGARRLVDLLHRRSPDGAVVARSWRHALHLGHEGAVRDSCAMVEDWGVTVAEVAVAVRDARPAPVGHVWNGSRDRVVDPEVGARMAVELEAQRFLVPGIGHAAILVGQADAFLAALDDAAGAGHLNPPAGPGG